MYYHAKIIEINLFKDKAVLNTVDDVISKCKNVYIMLAQGATYSQLKRDTGLSKSTLRSQKQYFEAMSDGRFKVAIQSGRIPSPSAFTEFKVCSPDIQSVLLESSIPYINSNVCRSALALTERLRSGKMTTADFIYELATNATHWRKHYKEQHVRKNKKSQSKALVENVIPKQVHVMPVVSEPVKTVSDISIPLNVAQEFMQCSNQYSEDMTPDETRQYIIQRLTDYIDRRNNVSGFNSRQKGIIDLNYAFIQSHKDNLAYLNKKKEATKHNIATNSGGQFDGVTRLAEIMCAIDIANEDLNVAVLLAEDYIVAHTERHQTTGREPEIGILQGKRVCHPDLCVIDFHNKTVDFVDVKMKKAFIGRNIPKNLTGADTKSVIDYKTVATYYSGRAFLIAVHCEVKDLAHSVESETPTGVFIIGLDYAQKGIEFNGKGGNEPVICYEYNRNAYTNLVVRDRSRWALLKPIPKISGILTFENAVQGIHDCGIYAYMRQTRNYFSGH
jgi:uncharacterized protein YerC